MVIKSCLDCKYHQAKEEGGHAMSHCRRENCWSKYSRCIANKALSRFLEEENAAGAKTFSAIVHMYPVE